MEKQNLPRVIAGSPDDNHGRHCLRADFCCSVVCLLNILVYVADNHGSCLKVCSDVPYSCVCLSKLPTAMDRVLLFFVVLFFFFLISACF